jgi:ABC-type uncharacterized transport system permease subunit
MGELEQPASAPKMKNPKERNRDMWLLVLEAVGAVALLALIVWWTMFSGRVGGELKSAVAEPVAADTPEPPR